MRMKTIEISTKWSPNLFNHFELFKYSLTQPPMMRLKGISRSAQHHDQNYCTFAKESNNNPLLKALGQKGKKPIEHGRARKPGHSISSSTKRENFLVHHSSLGSLGETRRPWGFSIGGTWGQWRSRGGRKQELEDPEIVFPIVVTFVCFKVKVGAIWSPLSLFAGVW